jgi:membrane protein YdbS with pleckstrin-like domain
MASQPNKVFRKIQLDKSLNSNKAGKIFVDHINIRQSIFFLMLKLIFLDVIVAFLEITYFVVITNKNLSDILSGMIPAYNLSFLLVLIFIKIGLTVYVIMEWINEYYEIWPNWILHKSGFIIKNEERHPFSHIKSIKVERGLMGRTFGFGTITIYDWYLEKYQSLYLIHNPIKYFNIIESLIPRTEEEKQVFQDEEEQ